jgi:hypothetical protein
VLGGECAQEECSFELTTYFGASPRSTRLIHNFLFGHIPAHYDPDR